MPIYKYAKGFPDNSYIFPTDCGWFYTALFIKSPEIFNSYPLLFNTGLVYEICLTRTPLDISPSTKKDKLVHQTILDIIQKHFTLQSKLCFYYYLCDARDRKEAARNALFVKWFERAPSSEWQLFNYCISEVQGGINKHFVGFFAHRTHSSFLDVDNALTTYIQEELAHGKFP